MAVVVSFALIALRAPNALVPISAGPAPTTGVTADRDELARIPAGTHALVRVADDLTPRMDGRVYVLSRDGVARAGGLSCKQVDVSPAGPGICLRVSADGTGYRGIVFDRRYRPVRSFPIAGVPDRARVSLDGRYAGYTTFDRGSSVGYFANSSDFSTDTRIVDLRTGGTVLALGRDLVVTREGRRVSSEDAQFWGVTFAGNDAFYATMATGFAHYLIRGEVHSGGARVIANRVECPALSPDGTRIAYKRRIPYTTTWRLHVLDLATGRDVQLAERRSIDDQPEWWGNDRVAYSDDRSVFAVAADGSGRVKRVAGHATSPAFVSAEGG